MEAQATVNRRGWVMDQLMLVGQLEAAMGHIDERITDLWIQLEGEEDTDAISKISNELSALYDTQRGLYDARVAAETAIFDAFPNADRTKWCLVKHLSMAYAIASENFHARDCNENSEQTLRATSAALGEVTSLALGFEPYGCLRCLDEAIQGVGDGHSAD